MKRTLYAIPTFVHFSAIPANFFESCVNKGTRKNRIVYIKVDRYSLSLKQDRAISPSIPRQFQTASLISHKTETNRFILRSCIFQCRATSAIPASNTYTYHVTIYKREPHTSISPIGFSQSQFHPHTLAIPRFQPVHERFTI